MMAGRPHKLYPAVAFPYALSASAKPTGRRPRCRQSPGTDPQSQPNLIVEETSSEVQGMAIREIRGFITGARAVTR